MSTFYRFAENDVPHFITMTLVEWVDLFSRKCYKDLIILNLAYCIKRKGLKVHGFVIMTNHIHAIVSSEPTIDLASTIRDFKRYTAKTLYGELSNNDQESRKSWLKWIFESQGKRSTSNETIKIWKHENHPVPLDINEMITQKLDYIHQNPVKAGICYSASDYIYSSAGFYSGRESILPIDAL